MFFENATARCLSVGRQKLVELNQPFDQTLSFHVREVENKQLQSQNEQKLNYEQDSSHFLAELNQQNETCD